jgi:hypothetical protein
MDSGGHAGRGETSLLWATDPDCVDLSRLPESGTPGPHFAMGGLNDKSSRRAGESAVFDLAEALGAKAAELIAAFDDESPESNPMTFGELEDLWEREFIPELRDYASMRTDRPEPPPGSRWRKNWSFPAPR